MQSEQAKATCGEKFADRVSEAERHIIAVCVSGADFDHVQIPGHGSEGDFFIGEDENGGPQ